MVPQVHRLRSDTTPHGMGPSLDIDLLGRCILTSIKCAFTAEGSGGDVYIAQIDTPQLGLDTGDIVGLTVSFGPGKTSDNS